MACHYIIFNFLFLSLLQSIYSMENNDKDFFSHISRIFNTLHGYTLYFPFRNALESARKNSFSPQDCEIIKNYIIKGADPNWKIGKNEETLLTLAIKYQKKDLFDVLLQHNADINATNKRGEAPLHALIYIKGISDFAVRPQFHINSPGYAFLVSMLKKAQENGYGIGVQTIDVKDLLKNGANFRAETRKGLTPLFIASFLGSVNCIKALIKYGADINEGDSKKNPVTPLIFALCNNISVESIKELCKLGASLIKDDQNNNIFHFIITLDALHYIEPLITHARFDDFDKGSKKIVPYTLWILNNWEKNNTIKLPKEIKLHILAQLPLSDLYPYKKLCKNLLQRNYNHILLPLIHQRVESIKQILASPNNENKTALQCALEKFANNQEYINKVISLLDETLVQKNYDDFLEHFPAILNSEKDEDKKNLVRKMFDNCAELFLE